MNTIFGIVYKSEQRINDDSLNKIWNSLNYFKPNNYFTWLDSEVLLWNLILHTSPQSTNEHDSFFHLDSDCIIISDSRLDYKKTLVQELGENWEEFKDFPDNYFILKSYLKWGEDCVKHLFGDFAFAIWNRSTKILFCARDQFGIRPFYYSDHPDFFIISTDFMAFNEISLGINKIKEQYILDSICYIIPDKGTSAYSNIHKLEPAYSLKYHLKNSFSLTKYWDLCIKDDYSQYTDKQAATELRSRFIASVNSKLESEEVMGLELSGGLDSSSIAACLPYLKDKICQPFFTYTHTMGSKQTIRPIKHIDSFDLCQKVFGSDLITKQYRIIGDEQLGSYHATNEFLKQNLKPVVQVYAMLSDLLYMKAELNGVKILLSGYGGDEGITFNGTVYLLELASQRKWGILKRELKRKVEKDGGSYSRILLKYFLLGYLPNLSEVIRNYNPFHKDFYKSRIRIIALSKVFRSKLNLYDRYLERGNTTVNPNIRERQYNRLKSGYLSDRLENSYYAARNRGIEYRYPFLDVKLIEFYYSLPPELKFKDGTKRYIFRKAMEGILDDRIRINPENFGATIPNTRQRLIQDESLFRANIEEGRTENKFHYVDYDRLLRMIDFVKSPSNRRKKLFVANLFYSAFSVILLQKWQREGKIDIGIKC